MRQFGEDFDSAAWRVAYEAFSAEEHNRVDRGWRGRRQDGRWRRADGLRREIASVLREDTASDRARVALD